MTTDYDKQIGSRIHGLMAEKGMTPHEISFKLGISYQQMYKNIRGENRIPPERMRKIANILDKTIGDLFQEPDFTVNQSHPRNSVKMNRLFSKLDAKKQTLAIKLLEALT